MPEETADLIEQLQVLVVDAVKKMGITATTKASLHFDPESNLETIKINVVSEDGSLLIGQGGSHLIALQHVIRIIANKKFEKSFKFIIDVNDYRHERMDFLENLAKNSAREAYRTKEKVILRPMTSYERRIIHQALNDNEFVETESVGVEPERKVVIKLKEKI